MIESIAWLPSHDATTWAIVGVAVLLGGLLRGLTGFGAALLMAPLMSLVIPARETLCLVTVLCSIPVGQSLSRRVIRLADSSLMVPMVAASIIGVPFGVWLISTLPARLFGTLIGVCVIVSAFALIAGLTLPRRRSRPVSLGVGLFSGVLNGFGGVGGPPAILYVLGVEHDPHRARANFIVFFACIYPLTLAVITLLGVMTWASLVQGLLLVPAFHVGGVLGAQLFHRINKRLFRPFVLAFLVLAGTMAAFPREGRAQDMPTVAVPALPCWCEAHWCSATRPLVSVHPF